MKRWMIPVATAAAVMSLLGGEALAQRVSQGRFVCNGAESDTCYFRILYRDGESRNMTMKGGQAEWISGIREGDAYCVNVNTGFPDARTCLRRRVSEFKY